MISISQLQESGTTYSLDVSALLSNLYHRLVGDFRAARDIESLQSSTIVCQGKHRTLRDLIITRYVQSQKMTAVRKEAFQSMIRQALTICKRQPLDPRTD